MGDLESLFCKQELGNDWYAGWHSECGGDSYSSESDAPAAFCPNCGKKTVLGKFLYRRIVGKADAV